MGLSKRSKELLKIPRFILEGEPSCSQTDPELFFPVETEMGFGRVAIKYTSPSAAKKICSNCPLINPCLEYALINDEIGIWGGTTEQERIQIKRKTGMPRALKSRAPKVW